MASAACPPAASTAFSIGFTPEIVKRRHISMQAPLVAPFLRQSYRLGVKKPPAPKSKPATPEQAARGKRLRAYLEPLFMAQYGTHEAFAGAVGVQKAALTSWWSKGTMSVETLDAVALALALDHSAVHAIFAGRAVAIHAEPPNGLPVLKPEDPKVKSPRTPDQEGLVQLVKLMAGSLSDEQAKDVSTRVLAHLGRNTVPSHDH